MLRPSYAPLLAGLATAARFIPREPPPLIFQVLELLCLTLDDLAGILGVSKTLVGFWRTRTRRLPAHLLLVLHWVAVARRDQLASEAGASPVVGPRLAQAERLLAELAPEIAGISTPDCEAARAFAEERGWRAL